MNEKEIHSLVDYYLTSRNVYGIEDVLERLVSLSTKDNYLQIIKYIENHPEKEFECEVTFYINEISFKKFTGLKEIIEEKLKLSIDKDAIEDLEEALQTINS